MDVPIAPTTQCIKVASLRDKGFANLQNWMQSPNALYVGRAGRVFITQEGNYVYHYKRSDWANPFVLSKDGKTTIVMIGDREDTKKSRYSLKDSLTRYEAYVRANLWNRLNELDGKVLGCFCKQLEESCHAQVLVRLWREKNGL